MFGPNIFPLARLVAAALLASTALAAAQSMDGQGWDATTRNNFYTRDQGTRLIPWSWISVLEQANGAPFMADGLARYGYLPNPGSTPAGLPVGFAVARGGVDEPSLGDELRRLPHAADRTWWQELSHRRRSFARRPRRLFLGRSRCGGGPHAERHGQIHRFQQSRARRGLDG